jgi:NAD(P)-dependent dehydrogenase (short-subunit alcohol dehydrogenase family)
MVFLTKGCCLTFLANPLEDLERRAIAGTSRPQLIVIVNIQANAVLPGRIDTDLTKRPSGDRPSA